MINSRAFANEQDQQDSLKDFRNRFYFPKHVHEKVLYFTGNSLGLQPTSTKEYVLQELEDWARFGVEGHFQAKNPWYSYHEILTPALAKIVGAKEHEVVAMNALTVNLHLLMASFYEPTSTKFKILCEAKAFPSDYYALESQVKFHGFDPKKAILEVSPRPGACIIEEEDILREMNEHKDSLACILIGGVNYYTGQVFDLEKITKEAHRLGILVGFDLAHAAGNIELKLHDWGVDFACWCSYKYLNSGPGGVSGIYIHEKHAKNKNLKRFAGWWGQNKEVRFKMEKEFDPIPTAEGWQLSNAPVLSMAAHKASLDLFDEAGFENLVSKSKKLTDYLFFILEDVKAKNKNLSFDILTPANPKRRGCQVSLLFNKDGKKIFDYLTSQGVIADWREPNVIRLAPVPLYNSFLDVWMLGQHLSSME